MCWWAQHFWGGGGCFTFYLEGEEEKGWRRAEARDVIKAPAEQICGSGVSTSEKSMAAAVAVLAVLQGLPLQECSKASSTFLLFLLSALYLGSIPAVRPT